MIVYNNQAPKAVNNVGQFGATEGSIGAYKSAAEYAADAKYWALLSQTKYSSVDEILAEVERLYEEGRLLEEDIKQLKEDFEAQQQTLLGLIQSTNTAIDNTNAATELSKEATQAVLAQLDIISNMTVHTALLPPGSMATGSYDNSTGVFSFGIPEGQPGRDGTDGTISDIGSVPVGVPVVDDYGFYVDKEDGGLYRANMSDIANLIPSVRSVSINGGELQHGDVAISAVTSFNNRTGVVLPQAGDYTVAQIAGAAKSGANTDITSLSGLTTSLTIEQGGTGATTAEGARTALGLGSASIEDTIPVGKGGTGATTAAAARTNLGLGLVSTESIVPITKGGTGSTSAENARLALVAAKSGDNYDITSLHNLTTALSLEQGGTGATTAAAARTNLGVYSKTEVDKLTGGVRGLKSYYGAVGDGITLDTNKLKTALDDLASGSYAKLIIETGEFLIGSGIIAEFGALTTPFAEVESIGKIRHQGVGNAIEIRNAFYCSFDFKFIGSGYDSSTIPNYRTADPTSAKQGLVIAGCRACKLKIKAVGYEGRVLRTKMNGSVKPSFLDLDITTGNDSCGQAFYLQGTDAWGCISFAQTNWDYWGSVIDNITDMTVVYWEAGVKNTVGGPAMEFKGLTNCHIGTIAAGGNEVFFNGGTGITVQKGLFGESLTTGSGNGYALRVVGNGFSDGNAKHQLTINNLVTGNATTAGIYLDAVVGVELKDVLIDGSNYGIMLSNLCRNVSISGELRNQNTSGVYALATANLDVVNFEKLKIYNVGPGTHGFDLEQAAGTTAVSIEYCDINVKGRYYKLPPGSPGVSIYGGFFRNSALGVEPTGSRPRTISNVTGINTRLVGSNQTFASGTASGGTITVAHGLVYRPTEINVTVSDFSNNVSSGSNTVLVRSIDNTNIVFKYSGTSTLSSELNFILTAKCEDRA